MSIILRVADGVVNWGLNPVNAAATAIGALITQVAAPYFEGSPPGSDVVFGQGVAHTGRALIGRCVRSVQDYRMESALRNWCNEAAGTPEHANRLEAAQKIRNCYAERSEHLDLHGLALTTLPAAIGQLT